MLGVGLGSDRTGEFDLARFGEPGDPRARAKLPHGGRERLLAYRGGEFEPRPVHEPRIPIWVAARRPNKLKRAARYDGFPIDLPGPDELAELVAEVATPGDVVVTNPAGADPPP